jgi:asparaginyl-tRNA synthetase
MTSAQAPSEPLTDAPRDHLLSPRTRLALQAQDRLLQAARDYLHGEGFTEILPPLIGPVTDPGARGAKQVDIDYYGHRYKLMTSGILYKQAALLTFDRVFTVAPNVRLEPLETAATHRHLAEFHQIDVELGEAGRDEAMGIAQGLVTAMFERFGPWWDGETGSEGADRPAPGRPFDRMTHDDAVKRLQELGHPQDPHTEIDWQGEELLSRHLEGPAFVTDYPKGSRGFYDREDPDRPGILRNFDLLAPGGYGELCSGGEREHEYRTVLTRIRETGENPAKYGWYLDVLREGIPRSAGFGLGVQRFTRYACGLDAVWQASAYPKVPGVVAP